MEIPIKMDDLGVPPFSETSILQYKTKPIGWHNIWSNMEEQEDFMIRSQTIQRKSTEPFGKPSYNT